jgi:hypothetical protein
VQYYSTYIFLIKPQPDDGRLILSKRVADHLQYSVDIVVSDGPFLSKTVCLKQNGWRTSPLKSNLQHHRRIPFIRRPTFSIFLSFFLSNKLHFLPKLFSSSNRHFSAYNHCYAHLWFVTPISLVNLRENMWLLYIYQWLLEVPYCYQWLLQIISVLLVW